MTLADGTTALDQPNKDLDIIKHEENQILGLVDRVIGEALEDGNFDIAWMAMSKFRAMNKASSLGACKLLHDIKANWSKVENDEEGFIEQAVRRTGYNSLTVERYVAVWELLSGSIVPDEFLEFVWSQTMRQLVKIASLAIQQEYELDHDDWRDLSEATDEHRTAEVCARVKGTPRNKNHMSLKIDEEGCIHAYQGKDEATVGYLFVEHEDKLVQKAVKRIMESSGITKRNEY